MNMRQAIVAALRRDPDLGPTLTKKLRARVEEEGALSSVVQAAEALAPIIEDAVRKRPSKLGKVGLKSAHLLASLAEEDERSNRRLAEIARGSAVGIVFVDVAGFTTFTAERGDEAAIELLGKLNKVVESHTKRCKGHVVKRLGDGFLLAFPSASQAVRGALSLRDGYDNVKLNGRQPLMLRIAVHAGEPLVEQDDLLGHDVNLTARLLDHCAPGEVIVSEAAKELAEKRLRKVSFGKSKRIKIRGLAGRVTVYTAGGRADPRQRLKTS
jgi:class 3 adenylate cyclase